MLIFHSSFSSAARTATTPALQQQQRCGRHARALGRLDSWKRPRTKLEMRCSLASGRGLCSVGNELCGTVVGGIMGGVQRRIVNAGPRVWLTYETVGSTA